MSSNWQFIGLYQPISCGSSGHLCDWLNLCALTHAWGVLADIGWVDLDLDFELSYRAVDWPISEMCQTTAHGEHYAFCSQEFKRMVSLTLDSVSVRAHL